MKKLNVLTRMLLLFALIVGSTSVWAEEETITLSEQGYSNAEQVSSTVGTNITLTYTDGGTATAYYDTGNGVRIYAGGSVTVTAGGATITAVSITHSKEKSPTISWGTTGTSTSVGTPATWSGSATSVTLNVTNKGHIRMQSVTVTYTPATKEDPTITFSNGSVRVGKTLDLSTLFTSNSSGAVTYSITSGDTYASVSENILTGNAAGSVIVQASQAAAGKYNAKTATATITVNPALVLSSIAVTTPPTKITYNEGETFDPTGMVVTATYTDASTDDVTASCTYSPDGVLETTDTEITISYTENAETKTTTQAITVNEKPTYEVTYHVGLETNVVNRKQGTTLSLDVPSDSHGYTFQGWSSTESTESPVFVDNSTVVNNNMELWAIFGKTVGDMYYKKVTTTAGITDGEYLIVYEGTDENHSGADAFKGSLETLDAEYNGTTVTIDNDNKIASTETLNANTFTIDVTNKTIKSKSGHYIGIGSYGNGLKQSDDADTYTHTYLGIDVNGNAEIGITFSGGNMDLRYNKSSNNLRFRYYKDKGQEPIALYKQTYDVEYSLEQYESVTITSAEYGTLYYENVALEVPTGAEAYTVKVADEKLVRSKTYNAGDVIAAGTAVVVKATANSYAFTASDEEGVGDANNLLKGSDVAAITTGPDGCKFYKLSLDASNTEGTVGFYWGAENGGAFTNGAHKAYLIIPSGVTLSGKESFLFSDIESDSEKLSEETTGIRSIEQTTENVVRYNLAGQKVGKDYKGILVINGKKVIRK